jgi:hypothetical protein
MRDADVLELVHRWVAAEFTLTAGRVDEEWRVAGVHIGALREAPAPATGGSR